jgi:CyaY protein
MNVPDDFAGLTDAEFHARAQSALMAVELAVDLWLQDDVVDIDASRTGGLLELKLPNGSQLVLNTQPPLHELWLASRAGGYHFKFSQGRWLERDGQEFFDLLSASLSTQTGVSLRVNAPSAE